MMNDLNKAEDNNANDSAFPFVWTHETEHVSVGLTKREYIATQLMAGIVSNSALVNSFTSYCNDAVICADALLKALEEKNNE